LTNSKNQLVFTLNPLAEQVDFSAFARQLAGRGKKS
jgi:hypothetical protein